MKPYFQIWHEDITGPARLSEEILTSLLRGNSVLFVSYPDLPWRLDFRGGIEQQLDRAGLSTVHIDCEVDYTEGSIDEFIVDMVAPDKLAAYLRQRQGSKNQFLKREVFSNTVIWIRGLSGLDPAQWIQFVADYRSRRPEEGLFVLEVFPDEGLRNLRLPQSISVASYLDYVTQNDVHLFSYILASRNDIPAHLKQYAARVCANLCAPDGEIASELIDNMDFTKTDPVDGLRQLFEQKYANSIRGTVCCGDEPHPFMLIRENAIEELDRKVWAAQLQTAFPVIELERTALVKKWVNEIKIALGEEYFDPVKYHTGYITQFGEQIDNPFDVELGTLVRMMSLRKNKNIEQYLLYIPDEKDRYRIHFLHQRRNELAHMVKCSPEHMDELL